MAQEAQESAQGRLNQLHIQRVVAPAHQLREQADAAEKKGLYKNAREIQARVLPIYEQAEKIQQMGEAIDQIYTSQGVEPISLEDFLVSTLSDPERPLLASLFQDPTIQEAIRTQVPREIMHQVLNQEEVDVDGILRSSRGDQSSKSSGERARRGSVVSAIGQATFGFDIPLVSSDSEIIEAAVKAEFVGLNPQEYAHRITNTKVHLSQLRLRLAELASPNSPDPKRESRMIRALRDQIQKHPHYGKLSDEELKRFINRDEGWEDLIAPDVDQSPRPRSDKNDGSTGKTNGGNSGSREAEKLPPLIDLNAFQHRILRLGLQYIPGEGLRDSDRLRLLSIIYERKIRGLSKEKVQQEISRRENEFDQEVSEMVDKMALARFYQEKGLRLPLLLQRAFDEIIDCNPDLSLLIPEELGQVLKRELPETEIEKRVAQRLKSDTLPALHIGPDVSTERLYELAGEKRQKPPSE